MTAPSDAERVAMTWIAVPTALLAEAREASEYDDSQFGDAQRADAYPALVHAILASPPRAAAEGDEALVDGLAKACGYWPNVAGIAAVEAARTTLLSTLATLRSERDAARAALAECQRERDRARDGLAAAVEREAERTRERDLARGHAGRAEALVTLRSEQLARAESALAECEREVDEAIAALEMCDHYRRVDMEATEAKLTCATERGERMREAVRMLRGAWGVEESTDAWTAVNDAFAEWDVRDAAGGEAPVADWPKCGIVVDWHCDEYGECGDAIECGASATGVHDGVPICDEHLGEIAMSGDFDAARWTELVTDAPAGDGGER